MTKPPFDELHTLYREGAADEPSPSLDTRILEAARAQAQAARGANLPTRPALPAWRRWMRATSTLFVAVFGVALAWRMSTQEAQTARVDSSPPAMQEKAAALASTPAPEVVAAPARLQDEAQDSRPAQRQRPPALAAPAAKAPAPAAPPTENAAPASTPSPAREPAAVSARAPAEAKTVEQRQRSAAPAALPDENLAPASSAQLQQAHEAELARKAPEADEAPTPQAWIAEIRALKTAGRHAEAEQSLARLRARYPDFVVPKDLNAD